MNEDLHQTGRTCRLIERAVREAAAGRYVHILISDDDWQDWWLNRIDEMWDQLLTKRRHGIGLSSDLPGLDWGTMKMANSHPNALVLADHAIVERQIETLQEEIDQRAALIKTLYPLTT